MSVKTVSGALNGNSARMSTRRASVSAALASELGYQPNIVACGCARACCRSSAPVAEGLITLPFATEIVRSLDNASRVHGLMVVATTSAARAALEDGLVEARRFLPKDRRLRHRITAPSRSSLRRAGRSTSLINLQRYLGRGPRDRSGRGTGGVDIVEHCFARGRRRIAFLNPPGISPARCANRASAPPMPPPGSR